MVKKLTEVFQPLMATIKPVSTALKNCQPLTATVKSCLTTQNYQPVAAKCRQKKLNNTTVLSRSTSRLFQNHISCPIGNLIPSLLVRGLCSRNRSMLTCSYVEKLINYPNIFLPDGYS